MKTTDKQIAANRRNAIQSTGPITPSGKARAARNALKHGLLAQEVVVDDGQGAESQEQFDALLWDLKDQFHPQGPLEEILVEKMAVAYWRLRRVQRYEVGLIRQKLDHVGDEYYGPDPAGPYGGPSRTEKAEALLCQEQEQCQWWQNCCERFTNLRQEGEDLQEIYDCPDAWHGLHERLAPTVPGVSDGSPAQIRASLARAGWTDDAIWQAHLDVCNERMEGQVKRIQDLQKQIQDQQRALEVKKKIGCVPDTNDLERLLKYEGPIERQFYRALNELERLQRLRAGEPVPAPLSIDLAVHAEDTV